MAVVFILLISSQEEVCAQSSPVSSRHFRKVIILRKGEMADLAEI